MAISPYTNPFLGSRGFGFNQASSTINIAQAGPRVFAADLANVASNTPLVRRNLIPFLIEAPKFFKFIADRDLMTRCLKAFVESHSRTITGLNQQITVDTAEAPYGGSGERIQVATNVTRAVSSPVFGGWELQGRAITKFIKWWITYGIGDESSKTPLVVSEGNITGTDYDASFYGMTVLFVEPDATLTEPVSAYLCTNMFPTATPDWESGKDASTLGENLEYNIEFTALTDVSDGTKEFAYKMLQTLNLAGMNPNQQAIWLSNVSADVNAAALGLKTQLEQAAGNRVVI